nr:MAG: replication associated protein [Cressdnaviricota sp.]
MSEIPKPKKWTVDCQLHFLTWPQCDVPLIEMQRQIKLKYAAKYGWSVICNEDHEPNAKDNNVGVHRHALIYAKSRFTTQNARFWDISYEGKTYHPHYEKLDKAENTKVDVLKYVIEDGDYIVDGMLKDVPFTIEVYLESVGKKGSYGMTYVAKEIIKGTTMKELVETVPGFVINNKRKIVEFQQLIKELYPPVLPKFPGFKDVPDAGQGWQEVVDWTEGNYLQPRTPKQKQLWLWSRTGNVGKSHPWLVTLMKYKRGYQWDYGDKQGSEILNCEYIVMDELKGAVTVHDLKVLTQMMGMPINIKYGNLVQWKLNVPLIVTANRPPHEVYAKVNRDDLTTLENRFEIIEVEDYCEMTPNEPVVGESLDVPLTPTLTLTPPLSPIYRPPPNNEIVRGEEESDLSEMSEDSYETVRQRKLKKSKNSKK